MNEISDLEMIRVTPPNNKEADRTRVRAGDVLLTITGSLIGRVAPVTDIHAGSYISQHVAILRTHGFQPAFLSWAISTQEGQRQIRKHQTGQTKPGLNFEQIGRLTVPRPSEELEEIFCKIIEQRKNIVTRQRVALAYTNSFFVSLQQRAFQGELDLSRLILDSPNDAAPPSTGELPTARGREFKATPLFLQAPAAVEATLRNLDDTVSNGAAISWSEDYFKYRILGRQPVPFSFGDVMQKAELVFEEPPYGQIKDMILNLLGQGGGSPILTQHFDEGTEEEPGRREILLQPA